MLVRGNNLKGLYTTLSDAYYAQTGIVWKWDSGEKGRVKRIFTHVAEAMSLRDEEDFQAALKVFEKYVSQQTKDWLAWNKRSRSNYLGFLDKAQEIALFVKSLEESTKSQATKLKIAGTDKEDAWEF